MPEQIILGVVYHRNDYKISLSFPKNKELNLLIKQLPFVRWSKTFGCWLIPCKQNEYKQLVDLINKNASIKIERLNLNFEQFENDFVHKNKTQESIRTE